MYKILHIEDNKADITLTKLALKKMPYDIKVESALDGFEGFVKLKSYKKLPNLVLIDLNMPKMGGKEFLRKCKANVQLKDIPVVILTSSGYKKDIEDCYDLKVNAYVIKEYDLNRFFDSIKKLVAFWLGLNVANSKNNEVYS